MIQAGKLLLCTMPVFARAAFRATALLPDMIRKRRNTAVLQPRVHLLLD